MASLSKVSTIWPLMRVTSVPKRLLKDEPAGGESQPGGQDSVVGTGRTAALEVTQDDATRLEPGLLLDGIGDHRADASESRIAERVGVIIERERTAVGEPGPLGDDHDAVLLPLRPPSRQDADQVGQVDRHLGHEDVVGARRDPGEAGDPARMAAHRLDDDDPAVALGRGPEPIDGLRDDVDGRVETEREIGHHQVVVDRLGDADDGEAEVVMQPERDAQRVVAADHDQGIQLEAAEIRPEGGQVGLGVPVGIGAR